MDPAEVNAAGFAAISSLDEEFDRNAVLEQGGAPFAGAGGDQQLAEHAIR